MIKSFGYHSFDSTPGENGLDLCSVKRDDLPLCVNCSGRTFCDIPINTYNAHGRQDYYLLYLTSGKMKINIAHLNTEIREGSFLIIPPNTPYKYIYEGKGKVLEYLWCHFSGSYADEFIKKLDFGELPVLKHIGIVEDVTDDFKKIYNTYVINGNFRDLELGTLISSVLLKLSKHICATSNNKTLNLSFNYISRHYNEKITVEELAQMENLSPSRYNFLFKSVTGKSPIDYVIDLRIKESCTLLISTRLTIKEISEMVGFCDNHFFSKLFKSRMNMSPKDYRNAHLTNLR